MDLHSKINNISICSGIGGIELGLRLILPSIRTICYVEREVHACSTLVKGMEQGLISQAPIWADLESFDPAPWTKAVDIITAGIPCQPFSAMGKRAGIKDKRFLWSPLKNIIRCTSPGIIFIENVPEFAKEALPVICKELGEMGYDVECDFFTAAEVGLGHLRKRLFLVAYSKSINTSLWESIQSQIHEVIQAGGYCSTVDLQDVPHKSEKEKWKTKDFSNKPCFLNQNDELSSELGFVKSSHKLSQIRLLGNAVAPACAAYAFALLSLRVFGRTGNKI